MPRPADARLPGTIGTLGDLAPAPPGLGRRGAGLAAAGVAEVALLLASLVGVIGIGSWRWEAYVNPDPGGSYGVLLLFCITILLAATILSAFFAASYTAWYRAAATLAERAEVERRWSGVLLAFVGIPFLVYGMLYVEVVGGLLMAAASLAFASGAWMFLTASPRSKAAEG